MRLAILLAIPAVLFAQEFEAVSIKPADPNTPPGTRGGPGSTTPGQIYYPNVPLMTLVRQAYGMPPYRISGPAWLTSERFDLVAKLPAGTTHEQLSAMIRKLLADRFALATHRESREIPVYEMVVAKGGPKFQESPSEPSPQTPTENAPPKPLHAIKADEWGFLIFDGPAPLLQTHKDRTKLTLRRRRMEELAGMLSMLDRPVIDGTGLKGVFDLTLTFTTEAPSATPSAGAEDPGPPAIFDAVQNQLGLKLESKKAPMEVLVIDRVERKPTEN